MEEKKKVIVIGSGFATGAAYAKMFAESEKFKVIDFPRPEVKWIAGVDPFDEDRPKLFSEKDKVGLNYLANVDRFWREGEDNNQIQPVSDSPHWNDPVTPEEAYQGKPKLMGNNEMISESYWMLVEMKNQMDKLAGPHICKPQDPENFPHDLKIVDEVFPFPLTQEESKELKKAWEAAQPKFPYGRFVTPMVFGTGGEISTKKEN